MGGMKAAPLVALLLVGCAGALEGTAGRANAVEVQTGLSPDEAYRAVAEALTSEGYALTHSDATLRTITTAPVEHGRVYVSLSAAVRDDGMALLQGTYTSDLSSEPEPVVERGMEGSPAMRAWEALEAVAARLPGERAAVVR